MRYRKTTLLILLTFFLLPMNNLKAQNNYIFTDIHQMDVGSSIFYLFDLNTGANIKIKLSQYDYGNFTLFLFGERPSETYINLDKKLDNRIFSDTSLIEYNTSIDPSLDYDAIETKIYYIQIILVNNGSDTFIIKATRNLSRYYIPLIPGFPIETTLGIIIITGIVIILIHKKKIKTNS